MPPCDHNPATARAVVSLRARFALLVALCVAPAAHALDGGDIIVISLEGEVQVTMNGGRREVRAGTVLELPAIVSTGRDGAIGLRQGATSVNVGPDTQLEFPAPAVPGGPIDRIQQPRGNAFYDVGKRGSRRLRVETPFLVAVVKGTQFNVAAGEDSATIALFEGQLEIRTADDSDVVDLMAGEIASRHRSEQDIDVIEMDASRAPPVPSTPPGAGGSEQAAPPATPRQESAADGDEYLAHDAGPDDADAAALLDARIDVSDTETLSAALVSLDVPAVVIDTGAGSVTGDPVDVDVGVPVGNEGGNQIPPPVVDPAPAPDPGGADNVVDTDTPVAGADLGGGSALPPDAVAPPDIGEIPDSDAPTVDTGAGASGDAGSGPAVVVEVSPPDVDIGVDLDGPGNNGNGNAYGHDKDNANGEANGHDKDDDDTGLLGELVDEVVNLLDDSLRKPSRK